jgi:hypothetical protein
MPDIQAVLDVTFNELSSEQQLQLKEVVEQFQQKCLISFSKKRSGVPFLRTDMPRVLMPGETDATTAAEKQEAFGMIQQAMEHIMARHNTAFLNSFLMRTRSTSHVHLHLQHQKHHVHLH